MICTLANKLDTYNKTNKKLQDRKDLVSVGFSLNEMLGRGWPPCFVDSVT